MESFNPFVLVYEVIQWILNILLSPAPPPPHPLLRRPRIAVVGAGLTGVASAAHCVGHGFDVMIFEEGPRERLGGIWSVRLVSGSSLHSVLTSLQRVNNTSGLQIHRIMYRFHPSVHWESGYPTRQQIIDQITNLWKRYHLDEKTEFQTKVEKIYKDSTGRWVVNNAANGHFDGVIAAVGSCGDPKMPRLPSQEKFEGTIVHSSELTADQIDAKGKRILVVGGGASAVEAVEFAVKTGAASTTILSRSDKWIIPRNAVVDIILAFNILGQETIFSWIPETLLRRFFYRDLKDLAPTSSKGLFTDTPMVNSEIFHQIRTGKASWLRGDILRVGENGIYFNHRDQGVPKGGPGHEMHVEGDIIIMATGFARPSLRFLPDECFQPPYSPPNYYLQVFPTQDPSIVCTNSTYLNALGAYPLFSVYPKFLSECLLCFFCFSSCANQ
jgi:thioredoxin reductase